MDPKIAADAASDTPDGTSTAPAGDSQAGQPDPTPDVPGADGPDKDWHAEADKWKALSRKHENANATVLKELEQLRTAQMSDSEKAIAEAESRGAQNALAGVRSELAEARLRVAATGKVADVDALVELVDMSKFVTEDGVNGAAIDAAVERFTKILPPPVQQKFGTVELGPQGGDRPRQLTRENLRDMTPQQIEDARQKGQLDHLLGITP